MSICSEPDDLQERVRQARLDHRTIGFVPTMGALHEGHLSLVRASKSAGHFTLVSIFVNPAQFGPNEDFETYPRDAEADIQLARAAGADLCWLPHTQHLYPSGSETRVQPGPLAQRLCGLSRPAFFPGILTVVLKLFNLVRPDQAFFGEKDFQQLAIIRRMARDFFLPLEVVGCATVREADGLAMSSRNLGIRDQDRPAALALYRAIQVARDYYSHGGRQADELKRHILSQWPNSVELDYLEFRDPVDLELVDPLEGDTRIFIGAWLAGVRLIDNASLI